MFEDIAEFVLGPVGLVLLAATVLPDGRKLLRSAAKVAVHAGLTISESFHEVACEAKERAEHLIEEIKSESEPENENHKTKARKVKKAD
jgi:hypothetical protein